MLDQILLSSGETTILSDFLEDLVIYVGFLSNKMIFILNGKIYLPTQQDPL